jgi:spore photoproduct lyase
MVKTLVYIEENILNHSNTNVILNNIGNPEKVIIKHYKDVFNQSGSNWRLQKEVQKIILAERTDRFYYEGTTVIQTFNHKHFYYNTLALNCIYDCDYCYLQGMFSTPHLVIFVNNNDFFIHTTQLINRLKEPVYLALSYDTDLLAIENLYPFCKEWIEFTQMQPNLTIEIRTKSVNIKPLLKLKPNHKVVLAWTLSPQIVIDKHEPKTPPLKSRLKAIKQLIEMGWKIRICIDPILHVPKWEIHYAELIEQIEEELEIKKINSFCIGTFRMNREFFRRIKHQRKDTPVLFEQYEIKDNLVTYSDSFIKNTYQLMEEKINHYNPGAVIEFLE